MAVPRGKRDWSLELREQWAPYSCLGLSAFFIARAFLDELLPRTPSIFDAGPHFMR